MKFIHSYTRFRAAALTIAIGAIGALPVATAQDTDAHKDHQTEAKKENNLSKQIGDLQSQSKRLEAALQANQKDQSEAEQGSPQSNNDASHTQAATGTGTPANSDTMKDKGMKMGMGKMRDKEMEMGDMMGMMKMMEGMKMGDMMSMKGMDMAKMMKMKGMRMMGMMKSSSTMAQSALPGFPGASHIYHIGSSEFFLDHEEHIQLTAAQQASLRNFREKAQLAVADFDRKIEQAEQELWVLTSSDQPEINKISAKAKEIGNLNAESRITYVRAVGEAAKILDENQRQALVGTTSDAAPEPAEHVHPKD